MSNKAIDKIFMANILRKKAEEEAKKQKSKKKSKTEYEKIVAETAADNANHIANETVPASEKTKDMIYEENNTENQTVAD